MGTVWEPDLPRDLGPCLFVNSGLFLFLLRHDFFVQCMVVCICVCEFSAYYVGIGNCLSYGMILAV